MEDLEIESKCRLSSWLYKILTEEGVWQKLLRNKYLHSNTLSEVVAKQTDSSFWKCLMGASKMIFP